MYKASLQSKALIYRTKSASCRALAACAKSAPDREQLLSMSRSWLSRADSEDWRDGLPPHAESRALSRWTSVVRPLSHPDAAWPQ